MKNTNTIDKEFGIVTKLLDNNIVLIKVDSVDKAACKHCQARIICRPNLDQESNYIKVKNSIGYKIGDKVMIIKKENLLLKISLLQYGFPLIGFLLGIFISYFLRLTIFNIPNELIHFIFGIIGVGFGGAAGRIYANNLSKNPEEYFEIMKN
ncbi:MAG: SoxR reducing system RseC family protein [Candidatus Marinimicrobia bacterium]|nr:SoxR reducing system RseC family protein [Candidatus Neomarinimicrobiota bacterium]